MNIKMDRLDKLKELKNLGVELFGDNILGISKQIDDMIKEEEINEEWNWASDSKVTSTNHIDEQEMRKLQNLIIRDLETLSWRTDNVDECRYIHKEGVIDVIKKRFGF